MQAWAEKKRKNNERKGNQTRGSFREEHLLVAQFPSFVSCSFAAVIRYAFD